MMRALLLLHRMRNGMQRKRRRIGHVCKPESMQLTKELQQLLE
jgi:hypothetical protein